MELSHIIAIKVESTTSGSILLTFNQRRERNLCITETSELLHTIKITYCSHKTDIKFFFQHYYLPQIFSQNTFYR